ncbi:MAG: hypothetical protein D6704_00660 [Nitrospirae bacterium]|nr:MAG: hypothetical protein D6704_00660 [Nitrospirota bacterium]
MTQRTAQKTWRTPFTIVERTLLLSFAKPRRVISSAVLGGGIGYASHVLNHQVDVPGAGVRLEDPARFLSRVARRLGCRDVVVGLMTAVNLRHMILHRKEAHGIWVEGFLTVGVTNAVRAGEPVNFSDVEVAQKSRGTINIILVTNAGLNSAAMVGAIGVATEAKTAALLDARVPSRSGWGLATGTGTDAIVLVTGHAPRIRYSGTHTLMGHLIGCVVREGVRQGLQRVLGKAEPSRASSPMKQRENHKEPKVFQKIDGE